MVGEIARTALAMRRQAVFGFAVLLAGVSCLTLSLVPVLGPDCTPRSLFGTQLEEKFFFDLFGIISACWLCCWVASINDWRGRARFFQWLGIIVLCLIQVDLLVLWKLLTQYKMLAGGAILAPLMIQLYVVGCFFGFFTLPGLTSFGNKTLTGLGTLAVLLPWLIGRNEIVYGSQYLNGLFS